MKKINEYKFKNNKGFAVYFLDKTDKKKSKFPDCDSIYFCTETKGKHTANNIGLGLRPDEALIVAKMLIDSVYKLTNSYEEKLLKGYYGYKEHHKV